MKEYNYLTLSGSVHIIRGSILNFHKETGVHDSPILINRKYIMSTSEYFLHFLLRPKINYLLIEDYLALQFQSLLDKVIKINSIKEVKSAYFEFHFKTFSKQATVDLEHLLFPPSDINIILKEKREILQDSFVPRAFLHKYEQFLTGKFEGEAKKIVNLFCKLDVYENFKLGPIKFI